MDYSTALKLKEAGFSQNRLGDFYITPDILIKRRDINTALFDDKGQIINIIDLVYKPTLKEMMDGCRGRYDVILKAKDGDERTIVLEGDKGLEEGVANVWLLINRGY